MTASQEGGTGFWPTETQELLLRASLLPAAEARGAFEAWEARIDLDRLDGASVRLLPLLYHNLVSSQLAERTPLTDCLRGIHRQAWYKNQLLLGAVSHLLARLSRAGIPALMLKGVPLALEYYPSVATRPMSDADILIPDRCASHALEILLAAGFAPKFSDGDWPPRVTASRAFAGPDGWECDVHTRLMPECWEPGVDAGIWGAAVPLVVNGTPTSTLAPEDHALHVLAHGIRRNGLSPVRWIADVMMIVGRKRPFDWRRLQEEARRRRLSLLVHRALVYLRERFRVEIPAEVIADLEREPIGLPERFEFHSRLLPGAAGFAAGAVSDYLRARGRDRDWQGPFGFVHYVRDYWRLPSSWQVPIEAGQRAVQKVRRRE